MRRDYFEGSGAPVSAQLAYWTWQRRLDRAARELRESGEMPLWVWEVVENVKRQIAEEEAQQAAGG